MKVENVPSWQIISVILVIWNTVIKDKTEHFFYRPQRSCGQGNVFTGVCLSSGGGEGVCLSACWDAIPPPRSGRHPPQGPGRHPPRIRQTPPQDQADLPPPGPGRPPPLGEADSSIRSTSGRYASYWNAFLLNLKSSINNTYLLVISGLGERHKGASEHSEQSEHLGQWDRRTEFHARLQSPQREAQLAQSQVETRLHWCRQQERQVHFNPLEV